MNTNILRVFAILLFIGAIFFGWYGYKTSTANQQLVTPAPQVVTVPQVITNRKVLAGEMLTALDVSEKQVVKFDSSGFSNSHEVIGKILNKDVESGASLRKSNFQQLSPAAELLKNGERALAIKIDEVAGVGGYIKPGDYVDVLLFANDDTALKRSSVSQVVLSRLRVISIGENIQMGEDTQVTDESSTASEPSTQSTFGATDAKQKEKPSNTARSAVLAVNEADATRLMLAASIGQLRLSLRGPELIQPNNSTLESTSVAATTSHKSESYFIKNDALLKDPNTTQARPLKTTLKPSAKQPAKKAQTSVIIVHSGDKTETITMRDVK